MGINANHFYLEVTYCECETKSLEWLCFAGKLYRNPGAGPLCQNGGAKPEGLNILIQWKIF